MKPQAKEKLIEIVIKYIHIYMHAHTQDIEGRREVKAKGLHLTNL